MWVQVRVFQNIGGEVSFEMIHGDKRNASCVRQSLCKGQTYQQRTNEARPRGCGDQPDVAQLHVGLSERLVINRDYSFDMFAARNFRNNATELVMNSLREYDVRQHVSTVFNNRDRSLIARRFDPKDEHLSASQSERNQLRLF